MAPRWASTSLPRSVPAASTAVAPVWPASPASTRAQACGAYPSSTAGSITYTSLAPYSARRGPAQLAQVGEHNCPDRSVAQGPGQGQRPQRGLGRGLAVEFDQDEHAHGSTPSSSRTRTSSGTASIPWPSTAA